MKRQCPPAGRVGGSRGPRPTASGLTLVMVVCLLSLSLAACGNDTGISPLEPQVLAPPTSVSAAVGKGANNIVITWEPAPGAVCYDIHWNIIGRVSHYDYVVTCVEPPFTHKGLPGQQAYFYRVCAVYEGGESVLSPEVWAIPRGSPFGSPGGGEGGCGGEEGGGGGEDEGLGNNLSVPIVFADGLGLGGEPILGTGDPWLDHGTGLRPTPLETEALSNFPHFETTSAIVRGDVIYYPQKTTSSWQADWLVDSTRDHFCVADWGDSLGSRPSFPANLPIRLEVSLYQRHGEDSPVGYAEDMNALSMAILAGSGSSELQGTRATTYLADRRNVFTITPRLRMEKLFGPGGETDITVPPFDLSLAEGLGREGPGRLKGEVTVSGRLVYGTVWSLKGTPLTSDQKQGWWRINFSLDPTVETTAGTVVNRTYLYALDPSDEGHAGLDLYDNVTWTEIQVVEGTGGGSGGCGGGGGGGGGEEEEGGCGE